MSGVSGMADGRVDRRRFFRAALGELIKPLEKKAAPLAAHPEGIHHRPAGGRQESKSRLSALGRSTAGPATIGPDGRPGGDCLLRQQPQETVWLRPPGALPEEQFRDTCSRCGECVRVCPAQCIRIEPDGQAAGCRSSTSSDAVRPLRRPAVHRASARPARLVRTPLAEIDMGTAVWRTSPPASAAATRNAPPASTSARSAATRSRVREGKVQVIEEGAPAAASASTTARPCRRASRWCRGSREQLRMEDGRSRIARRPLSQSSILYPLSSTISPPPPPASRPRAPASRSRPRTGPPPGGRTSRRR